MIKLPFSADNRKKIANVFAAPDGTIIFPTETFYALGCSANSPQAVQKIYHLKQRNNTAPLLVLVDGWEMLEKYAAPLRPGQRDFLEGYWPGALSCILKTRSNKLSKHLNSLSNTLAFRITASETARQIIQLCGGPVVGTSANLSGEPEVSQAIDAQRVFHTQVDLYVDGGKTPGTLPSTLIDMSGTASYTIIRQGVISLPAPNKSGW